MRLSHIIKITYLLTYLLYFTSAEEVMFSLCLSVSRVTVSRVTQKHSVNNRTVEQLPVAVSRQPLGYRAFVTWSQFLS